MQQLPDPRPARVAEPTPPLMAVPLLRPLVVLRLLDVSDVRAQVGRRPLKRVGNLAQVLRHQPPPSRFGARIYHRILLTTRAACSLTADPTDSVPTRGALCLCTIVPAWDDVGSPPSTFRD